MVVHAEEGGERVCTRGEKVRISCRDCAELWARMPAVAAINEFARMLVLGPPWRVVDSRRAAGVRSPAAR